MFQKKTPKGDTKRSFLTKKDHANMLTAIFLPIQSKRKLSKTFLPSDTNLTCQRDSQVCSVLSPPPPPQLLCNGLKLCHGDAERGKLHHLRANSSRISNAIPCFPSYKNVLVCNFYISQFTDISASFLPLLQWCYF